MSWKTHNNRQHRSIFVMGTNVRLAGLYAALLMLGFFARAEIACAQQPPVAHPQLYTATDELDIARLEILQPKDGTVLWLGVGQSVMIAVDASRNIERAEYTITNIDYPSENYILQSSARPNFPVRWADRSDPESEGRYEITVKGFLRNKTLTPRSVHIIIGHYFGCEDPDLVPIHPYDEGTVCTGQSGSQTLGETSYLRLKGGFHIHWYDDWPGDNGEYSLLPSEAAHRYYELGYNFVTVTEHDHITPPRSPDLGDDFVWIENCEEVTPSCRHILALGVNGEALRTGAWYRTRHQPWNLGNKRIPWVDLTDPNAAADPRFEFTAPYTNGNEVVKDVPVVNHVPLAPYPEWALSAIRDMEGIAFIPHPGYQWRLRPFFDTGPAFTLNELFSSRFRYQAISIHTSIVSQHAGGGDFQDVWNELLNRQTIQAAEAPSGPQRLVSAYVEEDYTPAHCQPGNTWIILEVPGTDLGADNHQRSETIKAALKTDRWWSYWTAASPYWFSDKSEYPMLRLKIDTTAKLIELQSTHALNKVLFVYARSWKAKPSRIQNESIYYDHSHLHPDPDLSHTLSSGTYRYHYVCSYDKIRRGLLYIRVSARWRELSGLPFLNIVSNPVRFMKNGAACLNPHFSGGVQGQSTSPTLTVNYAATDPPVLPEQGFVQALYDVSGTIPPEGATLTLPFGGEDVSDLGVNNLRIFHYDEATSSWTPLDGSTVNQTDQTVSATITNLGMYTISAVSVADTEPPTISWLSPSEGAVITGPADAEISVSDNVGVSQVSLYLDDREIATDGTSMDGGWGGTMDFSHFASGTYTLTAKAWDRAGNECTSLPKQVVLQTSAAAPQVTIGTLTCDAANDAVVVTGTASDTDGPIECVNVFVDDEMASPSASIDYDTNTWMCSLNSGEFGPGSHTIVAKAADEYGNETSATLSGAQLELCSVRLLEDPYPPQIPNVPITLTAGANGGSNLEYQFEVNGTIQRAYDPADTYVWTPSTPGTYTLKVYAREIGTANVVTSETTYDIAEPLSEVSLSFDQASPQPVGTDILLIATPTGGANVEYRFEVYDGTAWSVLSEYSSGSACPWTPTVVGNYTLKVTARDTDTQAEYTDTEEYIAQ